MRLVLDTDVMVAAIRSNSGASRKLLVDALDQKFVLIASTSLLIEYEAVMTRRQHLEASGISAADVGAILDAVARAAVPARLAFHWRPVLRDADDDMVMETAVNGYADAVITFNLKDFVGSERFGIATFRPGDAIRKLEMNR